MEMPKSKSYDGPSGIGRDSIWLTNEDLVEGVDATVTIEDVLLFPSVKFQGGRERVNVVGLKFKGKQRVLLLNATNRKVLNKAFSNITKAWKGQPITLYVTDTQMAGEAVKCVRIRNQRARAATAAEDFLSGDDTPDAGHVEPGADESHEGAFHRGCDVLDLTDSERGDVLTRNNGDYEAACAELNRMVDAKA